MAAPHATPHNRYRFLIIDDEPIVREGIRDIIDWGALGFELVGACRDGREGLQALERLKPDVVLTDICMPFVDGLELAAWIAEQYPATRTVLLTGYDEFEYAQEAVKLKVSDFLLKPITADELRHILEKIRDELDAERNRERRLELLQQQLRESLPLLRERFLNRLVRTALNPAEVRHRLGFLELALPGPAFVALVCDLDGSEDQDQLAGLAAHTIVLQAVEGFCGTVAFSTPREQTVVIVSAANETGALSRALECAELIAEQVSRDLGRTVSVGAGDPVTGLEAIPQTYADAVTALEQRLVLGPAQIITAQQLGGVRNATVSRSDADARAVYVRALKTGDGAAAEAALQEIIGALRRSDESIETRYLAMQRLLADALNGLDALGIDCSQITEPQSNPFVELGRMKTLEDMQQWFRRFQDSARALLDQRRRQHSQWKAVAAQEFIQANSHQPDLSLRTVCSALSVSKSYFSPIFKQHTGMTFVEYLTAIRMERAKELLSYDDLKSYEVAERVGFRDAHYFSLTFKKQTGLTPTEYRETARRQAR
ncbi:MAG: response regulator [Spirochaetaceae bacterium]|nr:MAG: response regulator [Spirochaetaceae bacterium]